MLTLHLRRRTCAVVIASIVRSISLPTSWQWFARDATPFLIGMCFHTLEISGIVLRRISMCVNFNVCVCVCACVSESLSVN